MVRSAVHCQTAFQLKLVCCLSLIAKVFIEKAIEYQQSIFVLAAMALLMASMDMLPYQLPQT
jgi:hypothetical protein